MKKVAIALGLLGGLAQLSIVSNGSLFEPSSPPPAAIALAVTGLIGAVISFKKVKLGGLIMLIGGLAGALSMVTILQGTTETGGRGVPPGLFAVTLLLSTFGNLLLTAAGILALVSRKAKPEATTG